MGGNAYARPYRAPPVDGGMMLYAGGSKNFNEMQDVSGPDLAPAVMPSDSWSRRRINFDPTEPVQATQAVMPEPNYGGGLGSLMSGMNGYAQLQMRPEFNLSTTPNNSAAQAQQRAVEAVKQNNQVMRQGDFHPYGYFTAPGGGQLWSA
jgi:hypothetical protein